MKQLALLLAALTPLAGAAMGSVVLQGTEFTTDTIAHYYFGPGMTHTHLLLHAPNRTVHVYAATLDSSDPSWTPEASARVEIGHDQCRTAERMTDMAARKTGGDRQYLAGINGDFFITSSFAGQHEFGNAILGYPNMSCAIDGVLAAPDMIDIVSRENALIIGESGMWIDETQLTYKVLNNDGSQQVRATALNYPRRDNEMMVYNRYMGPSTATSGGREIALLPAEGAVWAFNKSVKFIADGDWQQGGDMAIPEGGIVISCGPDYANEFIDGIKAGDPVKLKINLTLPAFDNLRVEGVRHIIGGDVRVLNCGEVVTNAIRFINTPTAKYARSLTGYSQDRSKLVMAAVDGNGESTGVTYYEAADLMRHLGCYDALDLDGGGSTALWGAHSGMLNKPRDNSERAIGNALFFTVDAPVDNTVASIRFADHAVLLPLLGSYSPVIYGYNAHGQLVDLDVRGFSLSISGGQGTVDGSSLLADAVGCYRLTASKDGMEASVAVDVRNDVAVAPVRSRILTDATRDVPLLLQAEVAGRMMAVGTAAFEWSADRDGIVEFNPATGLIHGLTEGTVRLTGTNAATGAEVAVDVDVEIASAPQLPLVPAIGADGWKINGNGLGDNPTAQTDADGNTTISFDVVNSRSAYVAVANDVKAYSLPDGFSMSVDPCGATLKSATLKFKAANSDKTFTLKTEAIEAPQTIDFDLASQVDLTDATAYPLTFVSLRFDPKNSADGGRKYTLRLCDTGFTYANHSSGIESVAMPEPRTRLSLRIADGNIEAAPGATHLRLYTPAGALVAATAGNILPLPAPGVYIATADIAGSRAAAKLIVR